LQPRDDASERAGAHGKRIGEKRKALTVTRAIFWFIAGRDVKRELAHLRCGDREDRIEQNAIAEGQQGLSATDTTALSACDDDAGDGRQLERSSTKFVIPGACQRQGRRARGQGDQG
jgi:hypothetical protein